MASGKGALAAIGLVLVISAAGAISDAGSTPVEGTISSIDRTCKFNEKWSDGTTKLGVEGSCYSTNEFQGIRDQSKRRKNVDGKAVYHIAYTAPQDGQTHYATLSFTGRDDEFYTLAQNDKIRIRVDKDDPDKIVKD